jgi:hypothetical protein
MAEDKPTTKSCSKCKEIKNVSEFYFRSDFKHLRKSHCIDCVKCQSKLNDLKDINKKHERDRIYHHKNKVKRNLYVKEYHLANREKRALFDKNKYHTDLNFKLQTNLRNRIRIALKRNSKSNSTNNLIGCDINSLRDHLSNNFKEGMTWNNYGEWQVDHIIPCSVFDMKNPEDQKKCFHFSNLQPLWKEENRLKSNKIMEREVCYR